MFRINLRLPFGPKEPAPGNRELASGATEGAGDPIRGLASTDYSITSGLGACVAAIGLGILIFAVPSAPPDQRPAALMTGGGFLGLGLFIVVLATYGNLLRRKFGVSEVRLESHAPRVAGTLVGRLVVPAGLGPVGTVLLRLECSRSTRIWGASSQNGRLRCERESVWLGDQRLTVHAGPGGDIEVPFRFQIPPGVPATGGADPWIDWILHASARVPGIDYRERFEIAVRPAIDLAVDGVPVLPVNTAVAPELGSSRYSAGAIALYRVEADRRTGPFWPGWPGIGWLPFGLSGLLALLPSWARACVPLGMFLTLLGFATFAPFVVFPQTAERLAHWGIEPLDTLIRVVASGILVLGILWVTALGLRFWHKKWHLDLYGISFLRLDSWPMIPGGLARGVLEVPRPLEPRRGFAFRLVCARTRWFQRWIPGPAVATAWTGKWSAFQGLDPGNGQTEVPFELAVPTGSPESGLTEGSHQWYLEARARMPGVNYISRFIVPVGCASSPGEC